MFAKIKSLKLTTKIIGLVFTIIVTVVAVNYVIFMSGYRHSSEEALITKAKVFTALADETKAHVSMLQAKGVFDNAAMLEELAESQKLDPNYDYKKSRIFGTIPVVAGWTAAGIAAEREGLLFKVPAFEARNPDNDPRNDPNEDSRSFRTDLFSQLENQVKAGAGDEVYATNEKTNTLHYMRAIKLDASCMMCHGTPGDLNDDPDGDGKDPLGFALEDWSIGDMHGAFEVQMPLAPMEAQVAAFFMKGMSFTVPLVILSTLGFIVFLRALFSKPINNVIDMIKDIAEGEGDLTKRIDINTQDEIGELGKWFNAFLDKLHTIISDVSGVTREVASAATEIAASSEEIAAGMERQQQQTSQVSAAVEEMSASVTEVAQKAADASTKAAGAGEQAATGGEVVIRTVEGMRAISEQVNESAVAVGELGRRGEEIGEIISVINDIADQTNLLALNAAIEAARAGEHGRGFAVVADEVRKLAERTTTATEEVAESIKAIQGETTKAVDRMTSGQERVQEGVQLAEQAGQALDAIVSESQSLAGMIQSIAAASEEQSAASTEVSQNVEAINAITNESTEGVRQAAQAAAQLSAKSEQLQEIVGRFKLD